MCEKEQLIAAVFKRRPIWDPRHWKHRDRSTVQRLWREIELELGVDKDRLKTKWRGLRDYFGKELRKIHASEENDSFGVVKSTWPYFEMMFFLKDIWTRRGSRNQKQIGPTISESSHSNESCNGFIESKGIVKLKTEPEDLTPQRSDKLDECDQHKDEVNSDFQFQKEMDHLPPELVKIKTHRSFNLQKKITLKRLKRAPKIDVESDEDLLFFKSLIPDLKTFPRSRKVFFKLRVQELLYHEMSVMQQTELQSHDMRACPSSGDD